MKIEVGLSDLRGALAAAVVHVAKPNGPGFDDGLGVVRLTLTGHGLLVAATDRLTAATALIEADVHDDQADPIDLTPHSVAAFMKMFPAPGKDSMGEDVIRVESVTDADRDGAPSTVTFTDTSGMLDGNSITVTEYPSEGYPDVAVMVRGLLARQAALASGDIGLVQVVNPDLLHRFESAAKAFGEHLETRAVPQAPGADRGVLLVAVGTRFLGAVSARFEPADELPATDEWLQRLPGEALADPFDTALVWTTSTASGEQG